MKKKCMAVGGTAKKPATMEEQLAGIRGKVRPGYQAGGIAGQVDDLMNRTKAMPNSIASAPQPYGGSVIPAQTGQQAMQSATNFGMPPAGTAPASSSQTISTGDYSTGPKETGFIFSDGTRRDGLTQEQAKQLESQQAMQRAQQSANAPTPQAAAPLLSMAEKESALGLNPNRVYKPGSAMDPLASGGGIAQAMKTAGETGVFRKPAPDINQLAQFDVPMRRGRQRPDFANGGILDKLIRTVGKILPESNGQKYEPGIQSRASEDPARHGRAEALNPRTQTASSDTPPAGGFQEEAERRRKQMEEAKNYEAGGLITPVNLGQGLYQAIAQPIAEDWRQGNAAIKKVRDQYPTADSLAGINPFVAAAQVANDVAAGNVGGDTAINVAQAVPVIKGLSGMAKMLTKQAGPTIGATKFVIDMPNTVRKNVALTTGQTLGQPANAFAAGGMVRFSGKGGPRDDQIPVKVAGQEINVSNGENAVILPAKTAANPAALQAINGIIQATNDGRKPKAGIEDGGKYQAGAYPARIVPDEIDVIRGRLETARAQAQDAASRSAYKGELATRDAMTARAAEQANMQAALESAKSQPAINPRALPAQPIYRPNWTAGNNAPVLEGTVETAADRASRAASSAPRALPAPQPGTAIVPRTIDWTPGGNPSAGGPLQARSVDWTYGESGGPRQGIASSAQPQQAPRALPAPAQPASSMTGKSQAYKAGYAYQKAGGLTGIAGKALNVIAPATAAYQALGDNAIRVQGFRESDPGYDEQSGAQRLGTAAQQVALTAGDWGTKGIDVLGGWALPKDQPSFNDLYRERVGLLPGVTAPTTRDVALTEAERNVAPIVAKRSQQAAQQAEQQAQQQPNQGIAAATGNSGAIQRNGLTTTQMGRGFDPTKLTMAPGYGMATNAAGKTISVGPSEYVGADGKPTSRWTDTQAYKDAIARNERDKIRLAEMQAVRLGANPQQALQASQGIAQAAQQAGLAAQQAGQAQQVQQFAIDKAAREQSLIDAWDKAGTPEQKQAIAGQLKIMRGQQDKEGQFDATKGGQTVDPATGQIIDLPPVIFNKNTGQPVQQAQSAQQAVPPADKRTVGQTYQTPKGPMIWRGNGWEAAR